MKTKSTFQITRRRELGLATFKETKYEYEKYFNFKAKRLRKLSL